MNRTIKFRGKDLATGKWVYGDLLHPITSCRIVNYTEVEEDGVKRADYHYYDVDPDTVGQFTGLYDRNGKEIYEGDIIFQQGYSGKRSMLVRFEAGAFVCGRHRGSSTSPRPMLIQKRCEIIGNETDHPELLEK